MLSTPICAAVRYTLLATGILVAAACTTIQDTQQPATARPNWVATWTSSPSTPIPPEILPPGVTTPQLEGNLRYLMRVSAGGNSVRIALSGGPSVPKLAIDGATIALTDATGIMPETMQKLSFNDQVGVSLLSGGTVWSDPVALPVASGNVLAVSVHLVGPVSPPQADKQLVVSMLPGDDRTAEIVLEGAETIVARPLVTAILVDNPSVNRVIVAFGDSITDGNGSADPLTRGWPDYLAARFRAEGLQNIAIANQGIGGNRLLEEGVLGESALTRFDRDALSVPGVTHIILMEGINDIGLSGLTLNGMSDSYRTLGTHDIIAAYSQLISRAHARGVTIIGATLTPDLGSPLPGYATEGKEVIRQEVNDWIRNSAAFDAVIDFDAIVRDPDNEGRLARAYNSGDSIHPSDAGYRAMADAIDLDLFR
ncbi:MAG: SGNH/GDSL hydrolase family protein [Hyphomonas oceanitis]|uniref:SGNH/GDSL hydrolase family protein n=1 Tax=Hyphomonas oceanitis TaxID=81033 RepID=UPI00300325F9